jgi:hypothetical protein
MGYLERGEGGEEEGSVGRLDVLVDAGRGLLEDQGPEAGDLGDEGRALFVESLGGFYLVADCWRGEGRVWLDV